MKVKRYIGETVQDALQKVRTELGRDAIIINTRKMRKRGLKGLFSRPIIEVVAAIDTYESIDRNQKQNFNESITSINKSESINKSKDFNTELTHPKSPASIAGGCQRTVKSSMDSTNIQWGLNPPLNEGSFKENMNYSKNSYIEQTIESNKIEQEVNEIKNMLNKVYKVINIDEDNLSNIVKEYLLRLRNREVDEEIIEKIKDRIEKLTMDLQNNEDFIRDFIHNTLLEFTTCDNEDIDIDPKKVTVFVGPTGVGKTTTIAKLAALYTLSKKLKVGFITSDTYRIAAVEQLRTYSEIIDIPLKVIYSPIEFISAVEDFDDKDVIMVDTAGRSHKDEYHLAELKRLLNSGISCQIYLVISATTKMSDCRDIINSYSFLEDYKLLFTKLDETSSYGIIINASYATKKTLSYFTYGQSVPDDIKVADKSKIIISLLGDKIYEGSSR